MPTIGSTEVSNVVIACDAGQPDTLAPLASALMDPTAVEQLADSWSAVEVSKLLTEGKSQLSDMCPFATPDVTALAAESSEAAQAHVPYPNAQRNTCQVQDHETVAEGMRR